MRPDTVRAGCATQVEPVHRAPDDSSEQVTQALGGEPLEILERRDGWAAIRTAYGYPGWIRESALRPPPAAPWPGPGAFVQPVDAARTYLGAPYLWGGMSEAGIDCSGLVHMAYRRCGRLVVRDADQQEDAGTPVRAHDMSPGDLITYGPPERADHIAFWLGEGRILHATARDGVGVVEEPEPDALRALRRRVVRL